MKLLIDSHIFLWLSFEPEHLRPDSEKLLETVESVSVSVASLWELTIKHSKRRLKYPPDSLYEAVAATGVKLLPIAPRHLLGLPGIQLPHGDPFDRLLIAQSEVEGCTFMTADKQLLASKYRTLAA